MKTETMTRRAALAGVAALAPAAAAGAMPAIGDDSDAELIGLGKEFDAAWARQKALGNGEDDLEAFFYHTGDIVHEIEAAPAAKSVAGLAARARAFLWCHEDERDSDPFQYYETTDHRLLRLIFRDLLRLAGEKVPAWALSDARTTIAEFSSKKINQHRFPDVVEQMDMIVEQEITDWAAAHDMPRSQAIRVLLEKGLSAA